MKKIGKYLIMFTVSVIITLSFLRIADLYGGYWINIAWATGVWFGIESVLFYQIGMEQKKQKG